MTSMISFDAEAANNRSITSRRIGFSFFFPDSIAENNCIKHMHVAIKKCATHNYRFQRLIGRIQKLQVTELSLTTQLSTSMLR